MERLLKIPEVCDRTSLSRTTIYELLYRGEIPSVHVGRAHRIPESALEAWLTAKVATADAA
jgi:excisionase family DNA binding protein